MAASSRNSDVHRNICQLMLDQGIYSEKELVEHMGECIERHKGEAKRVKLKRTHDEAKDQKTLEGVVARINEQLEPLGLKVARLKSKVTGEWERYYGMVNLNEEDSFGKQDWLNKAEQEYFNKLVEEILEADGQRVEAVAAANLGRGLEHNSKLSASDAGKALEKLERGHWLLKSDDGFFSLGVRSELQRKYTSEYGAAGSQGGGGAAGSQATQAAENVQEVD